MRTYLKAATIAAATASIGFVTNAAAAQSAFSVVTVDTGRVYSDCAACKGALTQLQQQGQALQSYEQQLGAPLQTEQQSIAAAVKAAGGKTTPALDTRIQALQTKGQSAQQQVQQRQQTLQRNRAYVLEQINAKLGPIVQQVMTSHKASLAMDTQATLAAASTLDVTNEVLTQLNTQLPSVSTTAPAAAAGAAPAGRAAPDGR